MAIAPAGAALAASTTWIIKKSPNVALPGGEIRSVSCVSATSCTAVGSFLNTSGITDTLAEAWNGTSWHKQTTPNPAGDTTPAASPALLGVSCPVAGFCEAVGGYNNGPTGILLAEAWNGKSWTIQPIPAPVGSTSAALFAVSCTSATFCEAVGFSFNGSGEMPLAEAWNGRTWSVQSVPGPVGQFLARLTGVSCPSASFCAATGSSPPFAEMWNGTSWTMQAMPGSVGSVSCVSASFCEAAGSVGTGGGAIWNGTSWTAQDIPSPPGATSASLGAVSCSSARACEAVGSYSNSTSTAATFSLGESWNGTSWTLQSTPNPVGVTFTSLDAVSCAAAGSCEAGGDFAQNPQGAVLQALAEAWNGSSWALQHAAAPPGAIANSLNGVSCVSATFCEAVGTATDASHNMIGLAETWNGTSWKIQATPNPAQASSGLRAIMNGVSCVSAVFCEAVGFSAAVPGPGAWIWNGTSWTAQAVPGSSSLQSVSCTSADFCLAAGGAGAVETWNGSTWSQQSAIGGFSSASSVSCVSARSCEVVGLGPSGTQDAAAWNGTAWSVQATPQPTNGNGISLNAVSCVTANSCKAVGWYFNSTFQQLTLAERWNGSTWAVQTTPNPQGSTVNSLLAVWCTSASSCTAVGEQTPSVTFTLAQVWNGTSWTTQSTPNRSKNDLNVLNSVWCATNGGCTAVGIGADLGSVNATLVETRG